MKYQYPQGSVLYRKLAWKYPLIERSDGVYLYDEDGKRYIDASGGPMLVNIGHGVPEIAEALSDQARKIEYIHGTQFTTKSIEKYAKELAEILPGDINKVYLVSGGSEAIEAAFKLSVQYQGYLGNSQKYRAIGRWMSFHGCTLGTLSLGARPNVRKFYEPLVLNFPHISPCYCYRCPYDKTYPRCDVLCGWDLERVVKLERPETICAFIVEPVSGTSLAAAVPPKEYFSIIREICNKYNIVLIADEVMCGMGRTGRWFAIEHWGIVPDIITLGKGASGGYIPIGVMATSEKIVDAIKQKGASFTHGHSYTNTPMTAAGGLAVLRHLKQHNLIDQSRKQGEYLGDELQKLYEFSFVGDIRGLGMMRAIEFVQDKKTKAPFPRKLMFVERLYERIFHKGVVVFTCNGIADGVDGDGIMISPPFTITKEEIDSIIDVLRESFKEMERERIQLTA